MFLFTDLLMQILEGIGLAQEVLAGIILVALGGVCTFFIKRMGIKKDLLGYYSKSEVDDYTACFIPTHYQTVGPHLENEPANANFVNAREKLIPKFIKEIFSPNNPNKFYIVLAGTGMGKSTFMVNLFYQYHKRPFREYEMKLFPLSHSNLEEAINQITTPDKIGKTILLLDAFDEDLKAIENYKKRITRIIDLSKSFYKVIITCRTQFFPNEDMVPNKLDVHRQSTEKGHYQLIKFYISPFSDSEIQQYLNKKYNRWPNAKKKEANLIINQCKNLVARPMLLRYIDELLEDPKDYKYSYQVYEALIQKWIRREANFIKDDSEKEKRKIILLEFSRKIALKIYNNQKFGQSNPYFIKSKHITTLANQNGIKLPKIDMTSRSLLNRNAKGDHKFAHKSIWEYFIAEIYFFQRHEAKHREKDVEFLADFSFKGMDTAALFYREKCTEKLKDLHKDYSLQSSPLPKEYLIEIKNTDVNLIDDVQKVRAISLCCLNDHELAYIEAFDELEFLVLIDCPIKDYSRLTHLKQLQRVDIYFTEKPKEIASFNVFNHQFPYLAEVKLLGEIDKLVLKEKKKEIKRKNLKLTAK